MDKKLSSPSYGDPTRPGKHTKNDGTSPFLMAKSTISMGIFNSFLYVYQAGYIWYILIRIYLTIRLVGGTPTPLKNMSSSMGRMTSHIYDMENNIHL